MVFFTSGKFSQNSQKFNATKILDYMWYACMHACIANRRSSLYIMHACMCACYIVYSYILLHMQIIILQMFKWCLIIISGLVLIFSLLWPYIFTSTTEKELRKEVADKGQQIIELLKKENDAQREITELKDTIRLLNKRISSLRVNSICIEEVECKLMIKDCESKVEKLEDEIKLLQGQVNANTKEFATCQEQLDDCNIRSHLSSERSSDRLYNLILFGISILLGCGCCCCCSLISGMQRQQAIMAK